MGEGNVNIGNEETISKSQLKKQVDKKHLKNVNGITRKTNGHSRLELDTGAGLRCDLAYGDHVSERIFHKDDGNILEELIKTRQSFIRTDDLHVFPANVTNRRKRIDSDESEDGQRVSRARSVLADATEWSHLGRSTLVLKGERKHKGDKVYHEDTSDYIVASTVAKSLEITPEQAELMKKAQSRELASQRSTTPVKRKVRISKEQPAKIPPDMSKESSAVGTNKTSERDNVCLKLIGNIKKFCGCLPENLTKPSDTNQCKRKPKKVDSDKSSRQERSEKEKQAEVFSLTDLQIPMFGQLGREAGKPTEINNGNNPPANGTNTNSLKKDTKITTKSKNNKRPSLKYSRLRYNANSNNDNSGKLKCSVRLTGKDKGNLLVTGEDGKTHTLSFKINKDFNIVPES